MRHFDIESYMRDITGLLREKFGGRLLYVGLQGSYLRGEATEKSDIDVAVVIDGLTAGDLAVYRGIIEALDSPERSCGFICGKDELKKWNPLEMCNFLHGTKDYYGRIAELLPEFSSEDVVNFVKLSAGNLYHEITHRYIHADIEKNKSKLAYSYKNVFFILQSIYYLKTGVFYPTKNELSEHLSKKDKEMLERAAYLMACNGCDSYDFEKAFGDLFEWCGEILRSF